jgi:hypothetical protein
VAVTYLRCDATVSTGSWGPVGGTNVTAVADPVGAPDDNTSYVQGSNTTWDDIIYSMGPMIDAVEITEVKMFVRFNNAGAGAGQEIDYGIRIGSTNYLNGTLSPTLAYADSTKSWLVNPATSALFTKAQLDDIQVIIRTQDTSGAVDSVRLTQTYLEVTYQPIPAGISPARQIGAHRLRMYRRPLEEMPIDVPLAMLDLELGDDLSVTHPAGPNDAGDGWGATNWKRRLHQLREESIDLNAMTVTYRTRGRRQFLCTDWDTAVTARSSSQVEDGVARLTVGGTVTHTRASNAWVDDPGSRLITLKAVNEKPYSYAGTTGYGALLMESSATNYLVHSSAAAGATAVAALTVGLGSGTFAEESAPTQALFSADVSDYAYKFTAGSPHAADKRVTWPATASINANTDVRFSIDYMDTGTVAGDRLTYRIQRASDSNYWNDSTGAWGVGAVDNPLTLAATRTRAWSKVIDVGGSNTTLTVTLATLSGGTAARVDRVYHVQLENLAWVTSHIVTGASTYTRALQTYTVTNTSGKRPLNSTGGTWMCRIVPHYTAADALATGTDLYFLDLTYDASNWFRIYYDVSAGNLLFEIRAAGTTTTATKAWSPTRGTTYKLAGRWTSSAGELDLTARTHSIFIDGVKGTDATRAADPTVSTSDLYRWGNSSGAAANGYVSRWLLTQAVYSDAEIARGAP